MYSRSAAAWVVGMVFGLLLGISVADGAPAAAINPACGGPIGPGGGFILGSDVGPFGGSVRALAVDSVKLDLGGSSVSCDPVNQSEGIRLLGQRAQLGNGTVAGCLEGCAVS